MKRGILTRRRRAKPGAAIEMAPLIDMIFILLIFYVVSTSFVQDAGVTVDRPESASAQAVSGRYLPVAITKRGTVHVTGRSIMPGDPEPIRRAMREISVRRVVIQADRETTTGLLLNVMDTCKAAGATNVEVAAIAE